MRIFAFFLFAFMMFHCKNEWLEIQKIQDQVESLHDEPMAKMDILENYQKMAAKEFSNIKETDVQQKSRRDSLGMFIIKSQKAHDAMFEWMAQYHAPNPQKMDAKSATIYLAEQLKMAQSMRNGVFSALSEGEQMVGKAPKK